MSRVAPLAMLAGVLLNSCSIKEARTDCPCWLDMDITETLDLGHKIVLSAFGAGAEPEFADTVATALYPDYYERKVRKGKYVTSAFLGSVYSIRSGNILSFPAGSQADSLWAYRGEVDCTGESAFDRVVLHRQFAKVHIKIEEGYRKDYPYAFVVKSNVNGIDLLTLNPARGEYRFAPKLSAEGVAAFNLPRLFPDSPIAMEIYNGRELVTTIPLDEIIRTGGYNWLAEDLEDIWIGVDYSRSEFRVSVRDWRDNVELTPSI